MRVKICGITVLDDALCAAEAGADALGFVFWAPSPRCVEPDAVRLLGDMLPPFVWKVGVFVDASPGEVKRIVERARLDAAQLHGEESPAVCAEVRQVCRVIKAFRMKDESVLERMKGYDADAFLLDSYVGGTPGGTGRTFNWIWRCARRRSGGRSFSRADSQRKGLWMPFRKCIHTRWT